MPKARRVKKQTEADLKREWYIDPKQTLRYTGLAGIYWYYLSIQVRKEDFDKYGGKCVSCQRILERWQDGDCGHLIASGSGGFSTRFLRENLALQCKKCNNPSWSPDAPVRFAIEADRRWGEGTTAKLLSLQEIKQKEPKKHEYEAQIRRLDSYKANAAHMRSMQDRGQD